MLTLTKYYLNLPVYLHFIIFTLGIIQVVFIFVTLLTKIFYGIYVLIYQKDKLEVRN